MPPCIVPAGIDVGRLFDGSFLVVSRDARNLDQLMKVAGGWPTGSRDR